MIRKFVQGESPETDRELWCLIGAWAVSEEVHEALGMPITGRKGDVWLIEVKGGEPLGFAQTRMLRNKKLHLRYAYAVKQSIQKALTQAVLRMAGEVGAASVFTNDRETATVPKVLGFEPCAARKTGGFCRWEKQLS